MTLLFSILLLTGVFGVMPVQAATTYGLNQTWKVDGQWEFKITNVQIHDKCNSEAAAKGEQVVIITYQYKNIGYDDDYGLIMSLNRVYDEKGKAAEGYPCGHVIYSQHLKLKGTTQTASEAFVLPKTSRNIKVHVVQCTDNYKTMKTADFRVPVSTAKPTYSWNTAHFAGAGDYDLKSGQTWKVSNNWELTVTGASLHSFCNSYYDGPGEQVVLIRYNYKNTGFQGESLGWYSGLLLWPEAVYDEFGNAAAFYPCTHQTDPKVLSAKGTSCSASVAFALPKTSKYFYASFRLEDNDGRSRSAIYQIPLKSTSGTLAKSVKLNKTSLSLSKNKTTKLIATVSPSNASNKKVSWLSSDADVARVDSKGTVTATGIGNATITAITEDGSGKRATCTVNVPGSVPTLVTVYNSAKGADIRWKPQNGVKTYYIMQKLNGIWSCVAPVNASSLTKEDGNYRYIDTTIARNYGQGYIYSVAVMANNRLVYDSHGLPLYRLKQPTITSVTAKGKGVVEVKWTKETCQGYEVQYSSDNGKTWQKAKEVTSGTTVSQKIGGLTKGTTYIFRIRCQKTNKDRGRTWSQYSSWMKCVVK